ncbi:hypothetical protein [Streptacidiphilus melanogenes]|uniref:hypothetical protein n=1 Tax=Streptacidiphilus melanogenes TaxID=411235 RepID=UPI00126A1F30|nr:hypothetical protein [Streptacidiphilus melanogenes]
MAEVLRLLQLDDGFDAAAEVAVRAAETLGVDGLTVSLATGGEQAELVWCTDEAAGQFEDLQFTLGEGPGPDAVRAGAMVLVPDLARVRAHRWPALSTESGALAVCAVFCFPMAIGAIRVGVLTVVRSQGVHSTDPAPTPHTPPRGTRRRRVGLPAGVYPGRPAGRTSPLPGAARPPSREEILRA